MAKPFRIHPPPPEQVAIYRRMTPEQKMQAAVNLYWAARELKAAAIRAQHADWPEDQVQQRVKEIFSRATTY